MITHGELAPPFSLPGVVGPRTELFDLNTHILNGPLVLVFCLSPERKSDHELLQEMSWLELEPEVAVMGIIPDRVAVARRFQRAYDLSIPILSDVAGRTFECYGVRQSGGGVRPGYAIVVVDSNRRVRNCLLAHSLEDVDFRSLHQAVKRQLNTTPIKTRQ